MDRFSRVLADFGVWNREKRVELEYDVGRIATNVSYWVGIGNMKRDRAENQSRELTREFYARDTLTVARDLIGKVLVHRVPDLGEIACIINETEAYNQDEPSCHAYGGPSKRNAAMFMEGGHIYLYYIYGKNICINFVTEHAGRGCAVLLRGVLPLRGTELLLTPGKSNKAKLLDGPAKLVKNMRIPMDYYGKDMLDADCLVKIYDEGYEPEDLKTTTRIGISKAQELEWRFIAKKFNQMAAKPGSDEEQQGEEVHKIR